MAMGTEVFNRRENKYRLTEDTFARLHERLCGYMRPDAHNKTRFTYSICNIYYDTDDSHLIRTSLEKPRYKEKLRLRSYDGTPGRDSAVYVEIKKKFYGQVNKRRCEMTLCEAYNFLEGGELPKPGPALNGQVLREIEYLLSRYELKPKLYLAYKRRAFFGAENPDVRVSFDTALTARRTDVRLEAGIYGEQLLGEGEWLMEIKTPQNIPLWLTSLLSEYGIYPVSFSKYGTEYKRSLRRLRT
jgi:SPX domain protein involved in polyphosphate accumulation